MSILFKFAKKEEEFHILNTKDGFVAIFFNARIRHTNERIRRL